MEICFLVIPLAVIRPLWYLHYMAPQRGFRALHNILKHLDETIAKHLLNMSCDEIVVIDMGSD